MSDDEKDGKSYGLEVEVREMEIKSESPTGQGIREAQEELIGVKQESDTAHSSPSKQAVKSRSSSQSPVKERGSAHSPQVKSDSEETIGGEITVKVEPGQAPKLSRKSSQKVVQRPPQLYSNLEDKTGEAEGTFDVIRECTYANKYIGTTDHALECECQEEWGMSLHTTAIDVLNCCEY